MTAPKMTAADLVNLLSVRHKTDVFTTEMQGRSTRFRMDAWAMPRSWSKWTTHGYEIKVSRQDFVKDQKWPNYLPLCHEFSFVCPWGLIERDECPDDAGLLYATKSGGQLRLIKKAPRRSIEFPDGVLIRLAMRAEGFERPELRCPVTERALRIQRMTRIVQNNKDGFALAYSVSEKLRQRVLKAESGAAEARAKADSLSRAAEILAGMGITDTRYTNRRSIERHLDKAVGKASPQLIRDLKAIARDIEKVLPELIDEQG